MSVGELNLENEFMPVVNRSGDSHSGLDKYCWVDAEILGYKSWRSGTSNCRKK